MSTRYQILATTRTADGIQAQIDKGLHPRIDYLHLARELGAEVIDWTIYDRWPFRWLSRFDRLTRVAWGQAFCAWRRLDNVECVLSMGEDVAIPLSLLMRMSRRRPRHVLIGHNLVSRTKRLLIRAMGGLHDFDSILLMDPDAVAVVRRVYKLPPSRVCFLADQVDLGFWNGGSEVSEMESGDRRQVLSLGRARRDYATLIQATRDADLQVRIHAGSEWEVAYESEAEELSNNIALTREYMSYPELRDLIADSLCVVVPLAPDAHHSAGLVTVQQAMAMSKPVVLASSGGLEYLVENGVTGFRVPPGDPAVLREVIEKLASSPNEAAEMGRRGRQRLVDISHDYDRLGVIMSHMQGEVQGAARERSNERG